MADIYAKNVIIFSLFLPPPYFHGLGYPWIIGMNYFGGLHMNSQRIRLQKKQSFPKGWFTVASQR